MKSVKLRDSIFLRRTLLLLLVALLLWALLTSVLYNFITRPLLIDMKKNDLLPQAKWVANLSGINEGAIDPSINNLVFVSYKFFTIWTFIFYEDSVPIHTPLSESVPEALQNLILERAANLHLELQRDFVDHWEVENFTPIGGDYLFVAAPIFTDLPETGELNDARKFLGTVVMVQSLTDIDLGLKSLNYSLLLASMIVACLLILPVVVAAGHMVKPLNRIRAIALSITRGDFSQKADDEGNDEISDLGRAMNHMAEKLASSFNQLTVERNQLREIIDGISEGIIAVDATGQVTQINAIVWNLFQRDPQRYDNNELLGITGVGDLFRESLDRGVSLAKTLDLTKDRKRVRCQISPLYDNEGMISSAVGLFRDVTESERLEQTRRDYIANVSHELRTPITAMRALLEPLYDGMVASEDDRQRYYGILLRETLRLSRLIDDMLELSRLQSGRNAIHQGPVDLETMLLTLTQRFKLMAEEQGIHFVSELEDRPLPLVWGNSDRIEQIIIIYFDNALKFTAADGGIYLRGRMEKTMLYLDIQDSGSGIKAEDLPHVFDRFYKADKAHNEGGTGLGLSIARALADQLGMEVSVASCEGKGATFSLGIRYASEVMRTEKHLKDVFDSDEVEFHEN